MPTQDELARQLIDLVKRSTAAETVLLERRIAATLAYIDLLESPNGYAVVHIRAFLTGERDNMLDHFIGS